MEPVPSRSWRPPGSDPEAALRLRSRPGDGDRRLRALKPRLADLWSTIFPGDEEPYTSVVVPSLTLDQCELRKLRAASFYEERLLFLLIRLRNPRARLVYVTSQPVHPLILEYYFQFLAGIPASHARVAADPAVRARRVAAPAHARRSWSGRG